jgi:hypothetical protein
MTAPLNGHARSAPEIQTSLIRDTPLLSADEQAFMREIFDRVLIVGRSRYSPWDASTDSRHIPRERDEEIFDAVIYAAMLVIKRRRERLERLRCFKADEQYRRVDGAIGGLIEATFEVRDGQLHEIVPPGSEALK